MEQEKIELTESQKIILQKMLDFVYNSKERIFILKGYAGTGKTTMMKFLIENLIKHERKFKLLSTTGRAAKVLANHTRHSANTIHSMIYKYKDLNKDLSEIDANTNNVEATGQLFLVFEPARLPNEDRSSMVYIVDEASMISDKEEMNPTQAVFGSGRLLKELLDFDTFPESKFIFVGDPCQLPPIKGVSSPALDASYFTGKFNQSVIEGTLTEIMRQDNTIIAAGNSIRKLWEKAPEWESFYPGKVWGSPFPLRRYEDVVVHPDLTNLQQHYLDGIRKNGYNDAIFICNSNKQCFQTSEYLRKELGLSGVVQKGDLLMVVQNHLPTGLMNGDMVEVLSVGRTPEKTLSQIKNEKGYQSELLFREIRIKELFSEKVYTTLLLETTLTSMTNNLDSRQQTGLFLDFVLRMKKSGITQKTKPVEFNIAMQRDPYLNALRCTYGYAVTCHKAQGGEWNNVYIQIPRNITLQPTKGKFQWLYTALTRAKDKVHIVKDFFIS